MINRNLNLDAGFRARNFIVCDAEFSPQVAKRYRTQRVIGEASFRPHYLAPLKELCNRKFKSRFIAELEGNGSARAVGHQERVLVESLEVLNHDLLQMRGIVCGWE